MELVFPFKNIATYSLIDLVEDQENIYDFILTEQDRYPYVENYFLGRLDHFKDSLPNFENEILQVINTTSQETIDAYFSELKENVRYIIDLITTEEIQALVKEWNEETLKSFNDKVKKEEDEYFKSEDRNRKHLEEYETWDFGGYLSLFGRQNEAKKIKKINYNFFCVEDQPDLIDESYCKKYHEFLKDPANLYLDIVKKYGIPYSKGEIVSKVEQVQFARPVVFVEGEHDITFIRKAAEQLEKSEILAQVDIRQRGGWSNLDKIWHIYKDQNWETIPQKKLLLYDCDTNKKDEQSGQCYKRIIPTVVENKISKGIENLFPDMIVNKAIDEKNAFVDTIHIKKTKRGIITETVTAEVNKDEKKNFCDWICANATAEDFIHFNQIFELIESILLTDGKAGNK